ncbi:MAG: chromosome partitioning protein [Nitrospinae bacterium CG11_big_fil_rev_8_21_14_0_20_56_8]|nr:MAG: chromosome partitioning protein [Nitrospinae bacterium CG11_big_fil_rev_8_21_14_0_20_56_8]
MGKIICVANQKGGVAKTTTAINLSACLALSGRKVLLIDVDPQANATSGLGIILDSNHKGVYELILGEATLEEVTYPTEIETLKIVPSCVDLTGAEIELVNREQREHRLKSVLNGVETEYEFVVIDCPPSLGLLTLNALAASQSVLIPMQCEYYALQGLSHLLKTLKLVKHSLNPHLKVEGILLTMYDARTLLATQVRDQVKTYFKEFLLNTVIPRNVRLSEAPSHGKPIVLYAGRSKGADSYVELAKELIARSRNTVNNAKPSESETQTV